MVSLAAVSILPISSFAMDLDAIFRTMIHSGFGGNYLNGARAVHTSRYVKFRVAAGFGGGYPGYSGNVFQAAAFDNGKSTSKPLSIGFIFPEKKDRTVRVHIRGRSGGGNMFLCIPANTTDVYYQWGYGDDDHTIQYSLNVRSLIVDVDRPKGSGDAVITTEGIQSSFSEVCNKDKPLFF